MVRVQQKTWLGGWLLAAASMLSMLLVLDSTPRLRAALAPLPATANSPVAPVEDTEDAHRTSIEQDRHNSKRRWLLKRPPVVAYLPHNQAASSSSVGRFLSEMHPLAIATEHAMRNGLGAPLRR